MAKIEQNGAGAKPTIGHMMPWDSIGGVEIATMRLIRVTSDKFRHVAFCMPKADDLRAAFEAEGIETATYTPPEPSLRHGDRFYRESALVASELKRAGVDLVHFAETKAAYHSSLAAKLAGVPLLCHVRSRYSTLTFRERLTFLPVDHYIFVSEESRRLFALKLPLSKTHIVRDAIDLPDEDVALNSAAVRAEFHIPEGAPIVGMVARVNPQKDYFTLAVAAAEVLKSCPEAWFFIVGDNSIVGLNSEHYAAVAARLAELGITDRFIFTGFRTDVSRLLSAMDIFVLCTHREGLPLSILEAMSMGKPVVATAVDGIPEMILDGVTGYLHGHENSAELAAAIVKLIKNPGEAKRTGAAARASIQRDYTFEVFAKNISAVYEGMLG